MADTRSLVAATTGQEYLTLQTLVLKKPQIIIIINACQILRSERKLQTTGVRPSYSLPPLPFPSSTHSSKIDLSYPEILLHLSQNFHPTPKDRKKISVSSGPGNLKQPTTTTTTPNTWPPMHESQGCTNPFTHIITPKKIQIVTKFTLQNHQKLQYFCSKEKSTKGFATIL